MQIRSTPNTAQRVASAWWVGSVLDHTHLSTIMWKAQALFGIMTTAADFRRIEGTTTITGTLSMCLFPTCTAVLNRTDYGIFTGRHWSGRQVTGFCWTATSSMELGSKILPSANLSISAQ